MAFQNKNLSVIAYANGFTLWHYIANEPLADLSKVGYFDKVFTLSATGDIIILNGADGTAIKTMELTDDRHIKLTKLKD